VTEAVPSFVLQARGPYSLAASTRFLEDFAPAALAPPASDHTHWAFAADDGESVAGVCLRSGDGGVAVEAFGCDDPALAAQVARILSLDVDAAGFAEVGRRDAVVARLQERRPGLRPVLFFTPFEAAAWAIISHRMRIRQAAGIKARLAQEIGAAVEMHGERRVAFPSPQAILAADVLPGLPERKADNLRAVAEAAVEGTLDPARLRALRPDDALAELRELPGIGEFFAQLILVRGVGSPDFLPTAEPRLLRAVGLAYGVATPTPERLAEIAEPWRPFRSWVAFLLRVSLGELAGGNAERTSPGPGMPTRVPDPGVLTRTRAR
jgi:DNA-3-methyladenine glycosylase II